MDLGGVRRHERADAPASGDARIRPAAGRLTHPCERGGQLVAGVDAKLLVDVAEVVLDRISPTVATRRPVDRRGLGAFAAAAFRVV
jgi:hypothetical protein